MKVCHINFWPAFTLDSGLVGHVLREAVGPFTVVADEADADVVLTSVYWKAKPAFVHKTICVICENQRPNYTLYRYSLSGDFDDYGGRNCRIPFWYQTIAWPGMIHDRRPSNEFNHGHEPLVTIESLMLARQPELEDRDAFCCFVAGNPELHRLHAVAALSRIAPVEVFGNVSGRPLSGSKFDLLKRFRFNLCFENSIFPGYYTEKVVHAWVSGCVPLAFADPWFARDFNPHAVVNRLDFTTIDEFVAHVATLEESRPARAALLAQPLLRDRPSLEPVVAFLRAACAEILTGGRNRDVESTLRGAMALQPGRPELAIELGDLLMREGRYGEAVATAESAARGGAGALGLQLLGQALAGAGRLDEARAVHWRMTEAVGGLFARTLPSDRLISDGDLAGAQQAFAAIRRAIAPAELQRPRPPLRPGALDQPIRGLAIDSTNWLPVFDAEEIAAAIGIPVRLLEFERLAAPLGNDQPLLFLWPVSLGAPEYPAFRRLSGLQTRHPIVSWLFDNHTAYLNNSLIAAHCDLTLPAHGFAAGYLADPLAGGGPAGPAVPLAVMQWSRRELATLWTESAGSARDDRLHGRFSYYPLAHARNRLVQVIMQSGWDCDVGLDYRGRPYHAKSGRDRFRVWRGFKTSIHVSVANDLPIRVFDALAAGQVPIVPRRIVDLDAVIPPEDQAMLPIVRFDDYTVEAVRAAHAAALAAFDRGGEAQAALRHAYVRDRHMIVDRIKAIVALANRRFGPAGAAV